MMRAYLAVPLLGLAACVAGSPAEKEAIVAQNTADWVVLKGTAGYRQRIALPPNARLVVEVRDVSLADAPAPLVAATEVAANGRQVPLPFELRYDRARLDPRHSYAVSARILVDDQLLWITDTRHNLDPAHHSGQSEIRLDLVQVGT